MGLISLFRPPTFIEYLFGSQRKLKTCRLSHIAQWINQTINKYSILPSLQQQEAQWSRIWDSVFFLGLSIMFLFSQLEEINSNTQPDRGDDSHDSANPLEGILDMCQVGFSGKQLRDEVSIQGVSLVTVPAERRRRKQESKRQKQTGVSAQHLPPENTPWRLQSQNVPAELSRVGARLSSR